MSISVRAKHTAANENFRIGWAEADITPPQPVLLAGMFHSRISEEIRDRLVSTVWVLDSGEDHVVFVGCDLICISDELRDAVRSRLRHAADGPDPMKVVLNATHTHTGPEIRTNSRDADHISGASGLELQAMPIEAYVAFASDQIADAVNQAWHAKSPGGISYGLAHAVVGRNRRWVNANDQAIMGRVAPAVRDTFRHIEGGEDHSVNLIAAYDERGGLTGLVVNVACPAQRSQSEFAVSADWWHETRRELRRRFGEKLFVLPQCSAAGDQYSFLLYETDAHARMLALLGRTEREESALRLADAIEGVLPCLAGKIDRAPVLRHASITMELPVFPLSEEDARRAAEEAQAWRAELDKEWQALDARPELRSEPRWYMNATKAYGRMKWSEEVVRRFERQQAVPSYATELHMLRLGEVAIATNPFECYLDYGIEMKVRSPAIQTFLVQLAGSGTYLPSPRSVAGGGYGSVPASNPVGPEGGRQLVEHTVQALRELWERG
ncbi:MAG: hypothetical protein K0Q59_2789 [Paenibacillus sp.]|nr:hypothetical protein [Paenibacillus sp.]